MTLGAVVGLVELSLRWAVPLLQLAAVAVCLAYLRVSPRMVILLIGLGSELCLSVGSRLGLVDVLGGISSTTSPYVFLEGAYAAALALTVLGLAAVLGDVQKRLDRRVGREEQHAPLPAPPRVPREDDLRPWRGQRPDSPDVKP